MASRKLSERQKALFEEGAALVLTRWTALNLAVENGFGGPRSADKAEEMCGDVLYWFEVTKNPDPVALEEQLCTALSEDFNMEAQDGSPQEVACKLVQLHEECSRNDLTLLSALRSSHPAGFRESKEVGGAQSSGESSSDDGGSGDASSMDMEEEVEPAGNRSHAAGSAPRTNAPIVDDDGFTVVQSRSRGQR